MRVREYLKALLEEKAPLQAVNLRASESEWVAICLAFGLWDWLPPVLDTVDKAWRRLDADQKAAVVEVWEQRFEYEKPERPARRQKHG